MHTQAHTHTHTHTQAHTHRHTHTHTHTHGKCAIIVKTLYIHLHTMHYSLVLFAEYFYVVCVYLDAATISLYTVQ